MEQHKNVFYNEAADVHISQERSMFLFFVVLGVTFFGLCLDMILEWSLSLITEWSCFMLVFCEIVYGQQRIPRASCERQLTAVNCFLFVSSILCDQCLPFLNILSCFQS